MALTSYNRWQAFAVHFAISFAIFLVLLAVVFGYWYPGVLREADQSWQRVLMLIVGVDLVLGPLLTLIVFNPVKKSLKVDLSIIAIAQITALVAGLYTVHNSRPVALYLAYTPMGFEPLNADMITPALKQYISNQDTQLFYYPIDQQLPTPRTHRYMQLKPSDLIPLNTASFSDFASQLDGNFITDSGYQIPIASFSSQRWLMFDRNGNVLTVTDTPK